MGSSDFPDPRIDSAQFQTLRCEILRLSCCISSPQALELADLLHTIIRMRRPGRPLININALIQDEVRSHLVAGGCEPSGRQGFPQPALSRARGGAMARAPK